MHGQGEILGGKKILVDFTRSSFAWLPTMVEKGINLSLNQALLSLLLLGRCTLPRVAIHWQRVSLLAPLRKLKLGLFKEGNIDG